jgi:branched-subunit amino acid ABC-type transport system permease component
MDIFLQQILNGLVLGSVYALVALGYTMVYGILGLINFAHGEVVMIGAMIALTVMTLLTGAAWRLQRRSPCVWHWLTRLNAWLTGRYAMRRVLRR